jgi:thioesterase domain-containing protein/acyl carrier protein
VTVSQDLDARRALEERLLARQKKRNRAQAIQVLPRDKPLPLSMGQRAIYFSHLATQAAPEWTVLEAERLRGPLDPALLADAIDHVVAVQETLRLRIEMVDDTPVAVPCDAPPRLVLVDAADVPPDTRAEAALDIAAEVVARRFDLSAEPPFRAELHRFGPDDHLFILAVHHIACDEWSIRLLREQLTAAYAALARGEAPTLSPPAIQYADFAAVEATGRERGDWAEALDRRASILEGAALDDALPATRRDVAGGTDTTTMIERRLDPTLVTRLDAFARAHDATPFMTTLAGAFALLHLRTGRDDITASTQVAGRTRAEAAGLVGLFTNGAPIRSRVHAGTDFRALLAAARTQVLEALAHQEVRYEALLHHLRITRTMHAAPFARVVVTHRDAFAPLNLAPDMQATPVNPPRQEQRFDLWFAVIDDFEGRYLRLTFDPTRYDASSARGFAEHFEALLAEMVAHPDRPLYSLAAGTIPGASVREEVAATTSASDAPGHPSETVERQIAAIWTRMTKVPPATPDQSFFDAGGDSLMVMRLVHLIEEECGVTLPLADVFAEPSIRALALRVAAAKDASTAQSNRDRLIEPLVPKMPARSASCSRFFLVSGFGGHVAPFSPVARLIADRWEAIGVLDPAFFVDEPPIRHIDALAERSLAAIRSVGAEEPWILAGYSGGAPAAVEMARQLRRAGVSAGCVVIDAAAGNVGLREEASRLKRQIGRSLRLGIEMLVDRLTDAYIGEPTGLDANRRRNRRIGRVQYGRLLRHRLAVSDVPVVLIRSQDQVWRNHPQDLYWSRVSRLVDVFYVPGDHVTCIKGENETAFATALDAALTAVQEATVR